MVDKRLTPKKPTKPNNDGTMTLKVGQPAVNVRIPEIKVPQINVPESTVNIDMKGIEAALDTLVQGMNQLAQQQYALLEIIREHGNAMASAAGNQPNIEVKAPVVKMAPRPRSYSVEVEDENGDMVHMNIQANSPN